MQNFAEYSCRKVFLSESEISFLGMTMSMTGNAQSFSQAHSIFLAFQLSVAIISLPPILLLVMQSLQLQSVFCFSIFLNNFRINFLIKFSLAVLKHKLQIHKIDCHIIFFNNTKYSLQFSLVWYQLIASQLHVNWVSRLKLPFEAHNAGFVIHLMYKESVCLQQYFYLLKPIPNIRS